MSPFIDTYCWCLLSNHFHLLIKVKTEKAILIYLQNKPKQELTITEKKILVHRVDNLSKVVNPETALSELIEKTFKRFFQSYALAFNKQYSRQGNLFYRPFKRVSIEKDSQFTMAIIYIHANAAKHKLVKDFTTYSWSSWHSLFSTQPTLLLREEIIEWFGSLEICIKAHKELAEHYYDCRIAIED